MAVITLSITKSPLEIISGIPRNISISTNIPSTIFYTLSGEDPTINDLIVTGPIDLTTPGPGIIFKAFAVSGSDISAIITQIYGTVQATNTRNPRDKVIGLSSNSSASQNYGIFGSNSPSPNITWGNTGGITVDSPDVTNIPDGYAGFGDGTRSNGTDQSLESYKFIKTTTNYLGETGRGIGTLPTIKITIPQQDPTTSDTSKKLFNPRALVIIQDGTKPPDDPNLVMINRESFSLPNSSEDGTKYSKLGMEGSIATGSFVKQFYNPREQTITYYYHDSKSLRWIISKEPYVAKNANTFNYSLMVMPSRGGPGAKYLYGWRPFNRRVLF